MFMEDPDIAKMRKSGSSLAGGLSGLLTSAVAVFARRIDALVERQERKIVKLLALSVTFLVGALFMLNGLAIFVSERLQMGNWTGYVAVGFVLVAVGLIFRK